MQVTTKSVENIDRETLQELVNQGWTYASTRFNESVAKIEMVADGYAGLRFPSIAYVTPVRLAAITAVHKPEDQHVDTERVGA